jgi:hypothetical protein
VASIFPKSSGKVGVVKYLLTLDMHHAAVFLEDTPPLPNALGPGSKPGLIFLCRTAGKAGRMTQNFLLVLPKGTR